MTDPAAMPAAQGALSPERQHEALVEVFESVTSHTDLKNLLHDIASRLRPLGLFDVIYVSLYDSVHKLMRVSVVEPAVSVAIPAKLEVPLARSPAGRSWQTQQPVILDDLANEPRFPEVARMMYASNLRRACVLPLTTVHRKLGGIAFARTADVPYSAPELRLLEKATAEIALAFDNALRTEEVVNYENQLREQRDRARFLLEFTNTLVGNLDLQGLFSAISAGLRRVMHHDYASLVLQDGSQNKLTFYAVDFPGGKGLVRPKLEFVREGSLSDRAFSTGKPVFVSRLQVKDFPAEPTSLLVAEGLQSACCLPLVNRGRCVGALTLASVREAAFSVTHADLLAQIANQVAIAIDNALAFGQIAELKDKLTEEKHYLEDEIRSEFNFDEIIGANASLKAVLQQVETVGPTDAAVLILGETGTGKELVARAIHRLSGRSDRAFVKVNCSAIPPGLLESELFGHEKGSFTGATMQKAGRIELADKGTLFLDEVGDLLVDVQPKLLRVLQENEFERVGSNRTIRVNIRLIAATNRDLDQMVRDREFRSDLYYRLRVFPIVLPPLRERRDDIPLLVQFFTQKYARRMGKRIRSIPVKAVEELMRWTWPGNIRELENFIERSVILTQGPELYVPVKELKNIEAPVSATSSLAAAERQHILRVLAETRGVIAGPYGAAARLGLKRTTLQARLKKLGIARYDWLGLKLPDPGSSL